MRIGYYVNSGSRESDIENLNMLGMNRCVEPYYESNYPPKDRVDLLEATGARHKDKIVVPSITNLGLTGKELLKLFKRLVSKDINLIGVIDEFNLEDNSELLESLHEVDILISKRRKGKFTSGKKRKSGGGRKIGPHNPDDFIGAKAMYNKGNGATWEAIMDFYDISKGTLKNWRTQWKEEDSSINN
jgi:DNA invertase Pin-like site-specific DNA recombinase